MIKVPSQGEGDDEQSTSYNVYSPFFNEMTEGQQDEIQQPGTNNETEALESNMFDPGRQNPNAEAPQLEIELAFPPNIQRPPTPNTISWLLTPMLANQPPETDTSLSGQPPEQPPPPDPPTNDDTSLRGRRSENPSYLNRVKGETPFNHEMLGEFIDDGPRKPQENSHKFYLRRKLARINMGIERREVPELPARPKGQSERQRKVFCIARNKELHWAKMSHMDKMDPDHCDYDPEYRAQWINDKAARKKRNDDRRTLALQRKREFYKMKALPKPDTPEPAEDSGDELYATDKRQDAYSYGIDPFDEENEDKDAGRTDPPARRCKLCAYMKKKCDLPTRGYPCTLCEKKMQRCVNSGYNERVKSYSRIQSLRSSFLRTPPPRHSRSRSASPMPEPCSNCRSKQYRTCTTGRPCGPCILYDERDLCDASNHNQTYSREPRMNAKDDMRIAQIEEAGTSFSPPQLWQPQPGLGNNQQQLPQSDEEQGFSFARALQDIVEASERHPTSLRPLTPRTTVTPEQSLAPQISPFKSLRQIEDRVPGSSELISGGLQPFELVRQIQQQARADHGSSPTEEMYTAHAAWELQPPLTADVVGQNNKDLSNRQDLAAINAAEFFDFSDWDSQGQTGLFNGLYLNEILADNNLFSASDVQAPTIAPGEGPLTGPVLEDISQSVFDSGPPVALPPTPPDTPVLPAIKQVRDWRQEAQDFSLDSPCCEWADAFVPMDDANRHICNIAPAKPCDQLQHPGRFCCCTSCHQDQQNVFQQCQDATVEMTKAYLCGPCAGAARNNREQWDENSPVRVGHCLCVGQMKKTWLCHDHRNDAITKVQTRVGLVGEWLLRKSMGRRVCPACELRDEDRSIGAWGCKGCREIVVEHQSV